MYKLGVVAIAVAFRFLFSSFSLFAILVVFGRGGGVVVSEGTAKGEKEY
jgi:hypothetical protein